MYVTFPLSSLSSLFRAVCAGMKCVLFALLVLICVLGADVGKAEAVCPQDCLCTATVVNCNSRGLTTATLPSSFPMSSTELHLHNNHLTALPTGLLDGMQALQLVTLHGNPWECDCAVLYLRGWLLKQNNDALIRQVARMAVINPNAQKAYLACMIIAWIDEQLIHAVQEMYLVWHIYFMTYASSESSKYTKWQNLRSYRLLINYSKCKMSIKAVKVFALCCPT